jgi:hypothetical protein
MSDSSAIYTVKVAPAYRDLAQALLATSVVLLTLHVLLSGQRSTGLIGSMFNSPFSETLAKVIVSIAFYYLVVRKLVTIV